MRTTLIRAALVLMAAFLASPLLVVGAASAADSPCPGCGVSGDPRSQSYRGALLIPAGSGIDPGVQAEAAHCPGCAWQVKPSCRDTPGTGDAICPGARGSCPAGELLMELDLMRAGWPRFVRVGTFCLAPGQPLTPVELIPGVRDQFVRYLPGLRPTYQPGGRGIVNLPVLFAAGQPESLGRRAFTLGGSGIVLDAQASWHWEFGDGASGDFNVPGGGYPDTSVSHTYLRQQVCSAQVTTTWAGEFWVDGTGPFEVTGPPVVQTAGLTVPVKEARAVLVGSPSLSGWSEWPRPG